MSRAPLVMAKAREAFARGNVTVYDSTLGWRFVNPRMEALHGTHALGETAELVAELHQRLARGAGRVRAREPAALGRRAGGRAVRRRAGAPSRSRGARGRPEAVRGRRAPAAGRRPPPSWPRCKPAFRKAGGTVTAGNSSGINDGAAALLLASEAGLKRLGRAPLARFVGVGGRRRRAEATWASGRSPRRRRRSRAPGSPSRELDLVELNEAFAAQAIPCVRELGLDPARVNVNGGAIALGHPLGVLGRAAGDDAGRTSSRAGAARLRPGDDVHRRRAGDRRHLRARMNDADRRRRSTRTRTLALAAAAHEIKNALGPLAMTLAARRAAGCRPGSRCRRPTWRSRARRCAGWRAGRGPARSDARRSGRAGVSPARVRPGRRRRRGRRRSSGAASRRRSWSSLPATPLDRLASTPGGCSR